jgi:hypothetical protein
LLISCLTLVPIHMFSAVFLWIFLVLWILWDWFSISRIFSAFPTSSTLSKTYHLVFVKKILFFSCACLWSRCVYMAALPWQALVWFYFVLFYLFAYIVVLAVNPKASGWLSLCHFSYSSSLLVPFKTFFILVIRHLHLRECQELGLISSVYYRLIQAVNHRAVLVSLFGQSCAERNTHWSLQNFTNICTK